MTDGFGSDLIINDAHGPYPDFEVFGLTKDVVPGAVTVNGTGVNNPIVTMQDYDVIGSSGNQFIVNEGTVSANNVEFYGDVVMYAATSNEAIFAQLATFDSPITFSDEVFTGTFASIVNSYVSAKTIGPQDFTTGDADSTPSLANRTYYGGATYNGNTGYNTTTDSVGNASTVSGTTLTDALNSVLQLNGSSVMTGDLQMGGQSIQNLSSIVDTNTSTTVASWSPTDDLTVQNAGSSTSPTLTVNQGNPTNGAASAQFNSSGSELAGIIINDPTNAGWGNVTFSNGGTPLANIGIGNTGR